MQYNLIKTIKRYGAGLGVYFNKEERENYHIEEGDTVEVVLDKEKVISDEKM